MWLTLPSWMLRSLISSRSIEPCAPVTRGLLVQGFFSCLFAIHGIVSHVSFMNTSMNLFIVKVMFERSKGLKCLTSVHIT